MFLQTGSGDVDVDVDDDVDDDANVGVGERRFVFANGLGKQNKRGGCRGYKSFAAGFPRNAKEL